MRFFLLFQNDEDSVGKCEGKPQYIVNMRQFTINKTGGTVFFGFIRDDILIGSTKILQNYTSDRWD